jgi:hypothetical protein
MALSIMTHKLFSNYDGELPTLDGFVDDSWRNDVCPSMLNEARNLKLWVDYVDPDRREVGGTRYTLCKYDNSTELLATELLTDIKEYLK